MTLTHIDSLFFQGNNILLDTFSTLGSTLSFSLFLFSSAYIYGVKIQKGKEDTPKQLLERVLKIYLVYLLLAIVIQYTFTQELTLSSVASIATLTVVPEFTEFLIAFILFALLTKILFRPLQKLQSKPVILILIAVGIFLLSQYIYPYISQMEYPTTVRVVIENIVGYRAEHRFPLTFYFIVYITGILFSNKANTKLVVNTFLLSTLLIFLLRIFDISSWYRWPPSILFISYGISFISFMLLIKRVLPFKNKLFSTIFVNIGKYPLEQFFISTLLIFLLFLFIGGEKSLLETNVINISILTILVVYPLILHKEMV